MTGKTIGMMTAAGIGSRLRPINLLSMTSMLSKGMLRILGIPLAEIQLYQFMKAGISDVHVVARYIDNRNQLSDRFNSADSHTYGASLTFSHPLDDALNKGSGDAILRHVNSFALDGYTMCFANDNLYKFDVGAAVETVRREKLVASMMTVPLKDARRAINTYGLVIPDSDGIHVKSISEKPKSEAEVANILGCSIEDLPNMTIQVNSAAYPFNNKEIRKISNDKWLVDMRKTECDMAGGLIYGLIEHGYPVGFSPLEDWADLGTPQSLIDTSIDIVSGRFDFLFDILVQTGYVSFGDNIWIHPESLRTVVGGTTLEHKIKNKDVHIGPNVYIGRDVRIENGVSIRDSNIDKWSFIGKEAQIVGSYISPSTLIWPFAYISNSATAMDVNVYSSEVQPTKISDYTAIGPKIDVPEGTFLKNATVWPGFSFASGGGRFQDAHLEPSVHERMEETYKFSRMAK